MRQETAYDRERDEDRGLDGARDDERRDQRQRHLAVRAVFPRQHHHVGCALVHGLNQVGRTGFPRRRRTFRLADVKIYADRAK
jgi:hypothetical protein